MFATSSVIERGQRAAASPLPARRLNAICPFPRYDTSEVAFPPGIPRYVTCGLSKVADPWLRETFTQWLRCAYRTFGSSRYALFALYDSNCKRIFSLSLAVGALSAFANSTAFDCHSQALAKS